MSNVIKIFTLFRIHTNRHVVFIRLDTDFVVPKKSVALFLSTSQSLKVYIVLSVDDNLNYGNHDTGIFTEFEFNSNLNFKQLDIKTKAR